MPTLTEIQKVNMGVGLYVKWSKVLAGTVKGLPATTQSKKNEEMLLRRREQRAAQREAEKRSKAAAQAAGKIHKHDRVKFVEMPIADLRKMCKEAGIKGYSKMRKSDMVRELNMHMGYI